MLDGRMIYGWMGGQKHGFWVLYIQAIVLATSPGKFGLNIHLSTCYGGVWSRFPHCVLISYHLIMYSNVSYKVRNICKGH